VEIAEDIVDDGGADDAVFVDVLPEHRDDIVRRFKHGAEIGILVEPDCRVIVSVGRVKKRGSDRAIICRQWRDTDVDEVETPHERVAHLV